MQRQSLGSPGTKLHGHGVAKEEKKLEEGEQTRKSGGGTPIASIEEENKVVKPHRSAISRPEKSIHLIPILTLFCLFVLYLCSYAPSQKDLAHFKGIRQSSKTLDSTEVSDFGRLLGMEKTDVLAIRSHRILQELGKQPRKSRFLRKIGDF
ncbi:hypothetical protein NE237_025545 [Protea cynaroides]|uniref:Uncharacterized protein n=1 Tax=Protea cynaroides TaxID=273540 RepID=A0A9Q0H791_9MAGN|nr:hypothetical protein NE237_025545 [Protea cynaroides]